MPERDALTVVQELVAKSEQDEKTIARLRRVTVAAGYLLYRHRHYIPALTRAEGCGDEGAAAYVVRAAGILNKNWLDDDRPATIETTPLRSEAGPGRHPFSGARVGGNCVTCGFHFEAPLHLPPAGFEWTGEYRVPNPRVDYWLSEMGAAVRPWDNETREGQWWMGGPRHILRPVAQPQPEWQGHDFEDHAAYERRLGFAVTCTTARNACHFLLPGSGKHCERLAGAHGPRPEVKPQAEPPVNVIREPRCVRCGTRVANMIVHTDDVGAYICASCA